MPTADHPATPADDTPRGGGRAVKIHRLARTVLEGLIIGAAWTIVFMVVGAVVVRLAGLQGQQAGFVVMVAVTCVGAVVASWWTSGWLLRRRRRGDGECSGFTRT